MTYIASLLIGSFFGTGLGVPIWWNFIRNSKQMADKVVDSKLIYFVSSWKFVTLLFIFTYWWTLLISSWAPVLSALGWLVGKWFFNRWADSEAGESL